MADEKLVHEAKSLAAAKSFIWNAQAWKVLLAGTKPLPSTCSSEPKCQDAKKTTFKCPHCGMRFLIRGCSCSDRFTIHTVGEHKDECSDPSHNARDKTDPIVYDKVRAVMQKQPDVRPTVLACTHHGELPHGTTADDIRKAKKLLQGTKQFIDGTASHHADRAHLQKTFEAIQAEYEKTRAAWPQSIADGTIEWFMGDVRWFTTLDDANGNLAFGFHLPRVAAASMQQSPAPWKVDSWDHTYKLNQLGWPAVDVCRSDSANRCWPDTLIATRHENAATINMIVKWLKEQGREAGNIAVTDFGGAFSGDEWVKAYDSVEMPSASGLY